jgi:polyphosphate kinase
MIAARAAASRAPVSKRVCVRGLCALRAAIRCSSSHRSSSA